MISLQDAEGRREIVSRIERLSPGDRALWGKMSVHQMICHLSDSFGVGLGTKKASSWTNPVFRTVVKWIALWAPLPWAKGAPTRPEVAQGKGGTPPGNFARDRATLLAVLECFCDELPQPGPPHPIFGSLTPREWWRWGYLHADHHLRQFGR